MKFKEWLIREKVWQRKDSDFEHITGTGPGGLQLPVGSLEQLNKNCNPLIFKFPGNPLLKIKSK